jgi:fumarylpyruvate hydrolase
MALLIRHLTNSTFYRNEVSHLNIRVLPVVQGIGSYYNILGNRNYSNIVDGSSRSSDNSSNNYLLSKRHNPSQQQRRTMMTSTPVSSKYVFDPPTITSLPVVTGNNNSLHFPVRRVYCVGKNYVEHVKEMGGDVLRSKPIFFTKPVDGVVFAGTTGGHNNNNNNNSTPIKYPPNTSNFHYEVELVVAIGKEIRYSEITTSSSDDNTSKNNNAAAAATILNCVYGYAVGIDLTRRDLQQDAKDNRGPWTLAKYFDESAPIGPISPISSSSSSLSFEEHIDGKIMSLTVNGEIKQSVQLNEMIWNVPEIITELLKSYDLKPGDLIMTGTPSGVGPATVGDRIIGSIDGGMVKNVDITLV